MHEADGFENGRVHGWVVASRRTHVEAG
jgi:hypothetical protein